MNREIVKVPADVLAQKAGKVTDFGREFQELVDEMVELMRSADGVGLAGPQVGELLRVIVVQPPDEIKKEEDPELFIVTNPRFLYKSSSLREDIESCLSIPGFAGSIKRPLSIIIAGSNRYGMPVRIKATGWLARIFQHEIDHLDGILYLDKAEKVWELVDDESDSVDPE